MYISITHALLFVVNKILEMALHACVRERVAILVLLKSYRINITQL